MTCQFECEAAFSCVVLSGNVWREEIEQPRNINNKRSRPYCGDEEQAWERHCEKMRHDIGFDRAAKPWSGRPETELRGLGLTRRHMEMADCVWANMCKQRGIALDSPASEGARLYFDASQNLNRGAHGASRTISLGQNSQIYSFEHDMCLRPQHLSQSLGYNPGQLCFEAFGDSQKGPTGALGEAISLPCLAVILNCVLVGVPLPGLWEAEALLQPDYVEAATNPS